MAMNRGLASGTPAWVVPAYTVALVFVFLGERVFSTLGWLREALTGAGVVALLTLTGLRWLATRATDGERRSVERALAILSTTGVVAILVYLTTAEPFADRLGLSKLATPVRTRYEDAATVASIALVIGSVLPMLFGERALFPMRRAARVEWRRVRDAMAAGLTLALAATYGALFCFSAGELEVKADFSYFHTARPSESTRKIAASTSDKLRVFAFFPQLNEVGGEVGSYLRDLDKGLPNVEVQVHDRLLSPQLAKDSKVFDDGVIVLERGTQRESLSVGTDIQAARPKLKTLDADFQKALLKVLREKRTAYFTVGHGELNEKQPSTQNEGRAAKGVREVLEQQNYTVRDLGAATGLGVDVPDDATIVLVLGPEHAFSPEEVLSLGRYADRGGKLLLCLDPEPKIELAPLADIVGLTVSPSVLANDKVHMRRRFNDSDRIILATNRFSSHASVSTLSRVASRPVFFLGAAALDKKTGADSSAQDRLRRTCDARHVQRRQRQLQARRTAREAERVRRRGGCLEERRSARRRLEEAGGRDAGVRDRRRRRRERRGARQRRERPAPGRRRPVARRRRELRGCRQHAGGRANRAHEAEGHDLVLRDDLRRAGPGPGERPALQPAHLEEVGPKGGRVMGRGVLVHVLLLALAAIASVFVWTREKAPVVSAGEVTVWSARSGDVEHIAFESKGKKVSLDAHKDAQGRWFSGSSEAPAPLAADAGAPALPRVVSFVSVAQAEKVTEALAPLKALREIGKIGDDRAAEFGLKEPDGTLSVTISGKEHKLTVGAHTPGGGDRYVRDEASGAVFAVKGDATRDLESGEGTLSEREPHAFKDADIESIRVLGRGKSREVLRRGPTSKRIWADPSDPERADETVSNWVAKVDRLRPTEYLAAQPSAPEPVVRIEYKVKGVQGAFLEIAKVPATPTPGAAANPTAPTPTSDFLLRTEHTRQWAKVYGPVGEQVEQDLASVVR